jgi:hypothetical protein
MFFAEPSEDMAYFRSIDLSPFRVTLTHGGIELLSGESVEDICTQVSDLIVEVNRLRETLGVIQRLSGPQIDQIIADNAAQLYDKD